MLPRNKRDDDIKLSGSGTFPYSIYSALQMCYGGKGKHVLSLLKFPCMWKNEGKYKKVGFGFFGQEGLLTGLLCVTCEGIFSVLLGACQPSHGQIC